ncbi:MAG TPA: M3 family metallopeptidase [Candidatus Absconditabacterales bacterium]|nr:M3 family metallopeptidase [Candidatus Absconditabacterales bacterium]HNG97376.1 M3 family metallopeptidase [Candidatus Absconditabacterales bacterium]
MNRSNNNQELIMGKLAIPSSFILESRESIKLYFDELLSRELNSVSDLEYLIDDYATIDNFLSENYAWRYIKQSCNTLDENLKQSYERFIDIIQPEWSRISDILNKKCVQNIYADKLSGSYVLFLRGVKRSIELFREENISLSQEESKLEARYSEITSKMTIIHEDKELTLKQAEILLKDADRSTRKQVMDKILARRDQDKEELDLLLDKLIAIRHAIALNCGFSDYHVYTHYAKCRFDYTIEDVNQFHQTIQKVINPLCQTIHQHRKNIFGYELKPYDFDVALYKKTTNECYKDTSDLVKKVVQSLNQTHPGFGDFIQRLDDLKQLDLDTRIGKGPGGYNFPLAQGDTSFIFMNASNDSYGLFTMLHECGHALHHFYTDGIKPGFQRYPGSEICEIASMAQELISCDKLDMFFENKTDYNISLLEKYEDDILIFPWISKIDLFQQWLYTHIDHTHEQRHTKWIELVKEYPYDARLGMYESWEGEYLSYLGTSRQKQSHIYTHPFYYIEYAIASLASIAMRKKYLEDPKQGITYYIDLLKVGDTKTMPDIFATGGVVFDFSAQYVQELMNFMSSKISFLQKTLSSSY